MKNPSDQGPVGQRDEPRPCGPDRVIQRCASVSREIYTDTNELATALAFALPYPNAASVDREKVNLVEQAEGAVIGKVEAGNLPFFITMIWRIDDDSAYEYGGVVANA